MKTFTRKRATVAAAGRPVTKRTRAVTVVTVARRAGVSIASVSRVLNGLPASPTMERRVRAAVKALGYLPDARGRSLKGGRTMQLALAVADVANPVYVEMMRAIDDVTRESGFRLVLHSTGSDVASEVAILAGLARRYVDGLILSPLRITPALIAALRSTPVPVVVIGSLPDDVTVDSVRANSRAGVGLAVAHLAAEGRRRIAFLNGDPTTVPGTARLEGYRSAVVAAGQHFDDRMVAAGGAFTYAAGHASARELYERAHPDAIFCANDVLALGAIRALTDIGVSVPADVAVAGMDDTEVARMSTPALTSVSLGSGERATIAARLLLERIADPCLPPRHVAVAPHLVVRESSVVAARRAGA